MEGIKFGEGWVLAVFVRSELVYSEPIWHKFIEDLETYISYKTSIFRENEWERFRND